MHHIRKCQRFEAEMAAQKDRDKLRAKEEERTRMLEAIQQLQAEREERKRTVHDYEMRISEIKNNYKFYHVNGTWYVTKEVMVSRFSLELNVVATHKFSEKEMLDGVILL